MTEDINELIKNYALENDTDVILYTGPIEKDQGDILIEECRKRTLRKNVLLYLLTYGGDPDAAYRIARGLQEAYGVILNKNGISGEIPDRTKKGRFTVFVDGPCKSAGTLICLAADEIIMSGNAELGPLDIQLSKKNEVGERESGLAPLQALDSLGRQSVELFKIHFSSLRFSNEYALPTQMAADIAAKLSVGLLSPVYAQIDPIKIAEVERSMTIVRDYGERLQNGNLIPGALDSLITGYPSHSFVIDRNEAKRIFHNVSHPSNSLQRIVNCLRTTRNINGTNKQLVFLPEEVKNSNQNTISKDSAAGEVKLESKTPNLSFLKHKP